MTHNLISLFSPSFRVSISKQLTLLLLLGVLIPLVTFGQETKVLSQTVRGMVLDADTQQPIFGATIVIINSDPFKGTTSDKNGEFRFKSIPVGRIDLGISYIGYESKNVTNVVVYSGKETVLTVQLKESIIEGAEVQVMATSLPGTPNNEMALIGARSISPEELNRLSASFNDPAFITANYAGVRNMGTGANEIIVRGNSPKYLQWRLEGVPITNPNHFANQNQAIGSTSILNTNLLATSDFYTAAFPAEFGNALSGVYDIQLRNGNNEQFEGIFGFGLIGTDITLEGPLGLGQRASYLVNYRNSTASILNDLGAVEVEGNPKFQDAAFKIHLPTKKIGLFTLFGIGGYSTFLLEDVTQRDWDTPGGGSFREDISEDFDKTTYMANLGIKHFLSLSKKSYLTTALSYSKEGIENELNQRFEDNTVQSGFISDLERSTIRFSSQYHLKINAKNTFQLGSVFTLFMQQQEEVGRITPESPLRLNLSMDEQLGNLQNFVSWKHRISEALTITAGLQNNNIFFTNTSTLEGRFALNWQFTEQQSLRIGYGNHSSIEQLHHYFAIIEDADGNQSRPNTHLQPLRANHFVLGWENRIKPNLVANIELYYQYLYDVPVENEVGSAFSTINDNGEITYAALVNQGSAQNYGVELSLQRFFSENYYFIFNTSIYESKYTALDGVERNTRFNGNYAVNLIAGKEFSNIGRKGNRTFGLNARVFFGGGQKIVPLLRDENGNINVDPINNLYWDESRSFENDIEDLYMITLSANYKIERSGSSHEIFLNLENITNNKGRLTEFYAPEVDGQVDYTTQFGLLPNLMYRIYF